MAKENLTDKFDPEQDWSKYPYPSLEEDFENLISDGMDCKWEDNGIGPYEFWGSKECQVKMQYNIQSDEVIVYVKKDDDFLPTRLTGKWDDPMDEYGERDSVEWEATLSYAKWESSFRGDNQYRHYVCAYSISENY